MFEEALLVFETQELNVEWYMKVTAADQKAIQCYHAIHDEDKCSYYSDTTGFFFKRVNRTESSEEPEPVS